MYVIYGTIVGVTCTMCEGTIPHCDDLSRLWLDYARELSMELPWSDRLVVVYTANLKRLTARTRGIVICVCAAGSPCSLPKIVPDSVLSHARVF